MKIVVSAVLLVILAWLVFSAPDKKNSRQPESVASDASFQEGERDSEALTQALNSIEQVKNDIQPGSTAIEPAPEPEAIAVAEINKDGENAVTVVAEEFAPLKGIDLENPAAAKFQPPASEIVDPADFASIIAKAETAPSAINASGDSYLSALEDEASVTDLAIRKINSAIAQIKPQAGDSSDTYLTGLAGEADETSVEVAYVAGGTEPIEDLKSKIENAGNIYTVKDGDSLSLIAAQYYGDALMYHRIFAANQDTMQDEDILAIGQKLVIPMRQ